MIDGSIFFLYNENRIYDGFHESQKRIRGSKGFDRGHAAGEAIRP